MSKKIYPLIQKPCAKGWEGLTGDAKRRFCEECQHEVHNLDELSPEERARVLRAPGRKCVAYADTADGARVPIGIWKLMDRLRPWRVAAAGLALFVGIFGAGCATTYRKDTSNCPPAAEDKAVHAEEGADGKAMYTVGMIVEEPPWWKRILHIQ